MKHTSNTNRDEWDLTDLWDGDGWFSGFAAWACARATFQENGAFMKHKQKKNRDEWDELDGGWDEGD